MESIRAGRNEEDGLLEAVARRGIVLLVVVVPLLTAWRYLTEGRPLGGMTFWVYAAAAGLLIASEHALAFDRGWGNTLRGSKTDFTYAALAAAMDKAILFACVTVVASLGRELAARTRLEFWPDGWNLGLQIAAALLIADAAAYFRHRLFHRSSLLWRFHRIHHSMTELYWIRSAYTHPLEQLAILMTIMLPVAFLGAGDQVVAAVAFLFGLSGLLQHANVDSRSSVLNYVFATPEVHRVHHQADERSDHSNFSAFLIVMDILFGTYRHPGRAAPPLRVGLAGVKDFPRDFIAQLALPFRAESAEQGSAWTAADGDARSRQRPIGEGGKP